VPADRLPARPLGGWLCAALAVLALVDATGCDAGGEETTADGFIAAGPAVRVEARALPPGKAEPEAPVVVSGCIPGRVENPPVPYLEGQADVRPQLIDFDYDADLAAELGLPTDPDDVEINLGVLPRFFAFRGVVASSQALAARVGRIPVGQAGVWYRQVSRFRDSAALIAITADGTEVDLGTVTLTDWAFAAGLGIAVSCPPIPPPPASLR
jgi:hypothetical protein